MMTPVGNGKRVPASELMVGDAIQMYDSYWRTYWALIDRIGKSSSGKTLYFNGRCNGRYVHRVCRSTTMIERMRG